MSSDEKKEAPAEEPKSPLDTVLEDAEVEEDAPEEGEVDSLLDSTLTGKPLALENPFAYEREDFLKKGRVIVKSTAAIAVFEWSEMGNWFSETKVFPDIGNAIGWVDEMFGVPRGNKGYKLPDMSEYD